MSTAQKAGAQRSGEDVRTRQKVLRYVLDHGPVSASGVARALNLTAAAIRRHLDALSEDGYVEVRELAGARSGRGRPARHYVVTSQGHSSISNAYDELAVRALDFIEESGGEEAVEAFAHSRIDELRAALKARLGDRKGSVAQRSRDLAAGLSAEGYASSASPVAVGTPLEAMQLCQGHCPIQHVAERFPQFCEAELDMFAEVLGVDVRRLSTLAAGGHVCTTHIPTSVLNRPLIDQANHNQGGSR